MIETKVETGPARERIAAETKSIEITLTALEPWFIGMCDIQEHDMHGAHLRMAIYVNGERIHWSGRKPMSSRATKDTEGRAITLDYWLTPCFQGKPGDLVRLDVWSVNNVACNVRAQLVRSAVFIEPTRQTKDPIEVR